MLADENFAVAVRTLMMQLSLGHYIAQTITVHVGPCACSTETAKTPQRKERHLEDAKQVDTVAPMVMAQIMLA